MKRFLLTLTLLMAAAWGAPGEAGAQPLSKLAAKQRGPDRQKLDAAEALLKAGNFAGAASAFYNYLQTGSQDLGEARYNLAKSLYRLRFYHSALQYFAELLQEGPEGRYYNTSLEWCLFLTRKMQDDAAVIDVAARYLIGDAVPKDYKDEFLFRLARFHFERALAIEAGEIAGALGETKFEETVTGGTSIQGDVFFGAEPEGGSTAEDKVTEQEGGGFSLGSDLFGDPEPQKAPGKTPAAPAQVGADGHFVLTAKEHTIRAESFVKKVTLSSAYGTRAKYLEGLILYKLGRENEALTAFKTVLRLTRPGGEQPSPKLRELAFFQLARTHFGAQQPSFSIFYYSKIDRDSLSWLDALYEQSWAEFRLGDYEKALGNLLTLQAPFFKDDYYPESIILKAVIYYENCRYKEAKDILKGFMARYEPVQKELARLTAGKRTAAQYYELLQNLRSDDTAEARTSQAQILSQILAIALENPELTRLDAALAEVDGEIREMEAMKAALGEKGLARAGLKALKNTREKLAQQAGREVKNQLERERVHIETLIRQSIRIDIETARAEQDRIESKLRDVKTAPKVIERPYVGWADDEKYVWPFTGEYWRDELGTYEVTLEHSCR